MRVRIDIKLGLCFLIVVLMVVALSYYSVSTSEKHLQTTIGNKSILLSKEIMMEIDKRIIYLLNELRLQSKYHSLMNQTLQESNLFFDTLKNRDDYLNIIDEKWPLDRGGKNSNIQMLMSSALSSHLMNNIIGYYKNEYGYNLITEIFVTNKYGAVAAMSNVTSDYNQSDEEWWIISKDKDHYLSDFEYDSSSKTYGVSIAVRINDKTGNFLGVLKAIISIQDLVKHMDITSEKYTKSRIHIITNDGKLIYRTTPFEIMEDISQENYFSMIDSNTGFFIVDTDEGRRLISYARSSGFKGFKAFNWTILICQDIKDVLGPVLTVKNQLYTAAFIIIVATIFVALITSRFIRGSIARLTQGTKAVGRGNLDYRIPINNNDEIGDLAAAFNQMTSNLKELTASRDELNKEVGERRRIEDELRIHQNKLLEMVAERTIGLQQVNEELETEIAERSRAEKDARLMALFAELNPSPVLRFDINGTIIVANKAASELLNKGGLIGKPLTDVLPDLAGIDFSSCIRNGSIFSHAAQKKERFYLFTFKGISDMNFGQAYGTDITDRKLAEADAMRVSHLASLGELAAGVAHEINNPINGIINFAQIIVNNTSLNDKEYDLALRIIKEGDRIADIVNGLLSFARAGEKGKYPVPVSEIISDTLVLTAILLRKEGVKLQIECPSDLSLVLAKPQQIEQVFLNLISNARYALNQKYPGDHPDKILRISCEESCDEKLVFVRVTFYDNGIGIPSDIMDKILNPFFSTKAADKGTGLGLSISHGIISDHGGRIRFESKEGEFTRVIVELAAVS